MRSFLLLLLCAHVGRCPEPATPLAGGRRIIAFCAGNPAGLRVLAVGCLTRSNKAGTNPRYSRQAASRPEEPGFSGTGAQIPFGSKPSGWSSACAVLVAGTLLAIAATLSRSAGAAQPPPPARFASQAVSFSYPAAWQQHSWPWSFSFSSLITYLSTTALHDPCTRSALELHCGAPLASLPAKGVLVTWTLNGFPGWSLARASGKAMRVDGRAARLSQRQSPDCTALGATRTLTAVIAGAVRDNFLRMEACLRGPKLGLGARQVRQMLESVRFS